LDTGKSSCIFYYLMAERTENSEQRRGDRKTLKACPDEKESCSQSENNRGERIPFNAISP